MRTFRALLALALLAGLYAVALLAALLSLALVMLPFSMAAAKDALAFWTGAPLVLGGLVGLGAIGKGLVAVDQDRGHLWGSVGMSRSAAPQLWAMVDQVAAEVGCAGPSQLYLTAEPNAAVVEETRAAGLVSRSRWMYIGMPLLHGLTTAQLRAVLAHELGHYARRHTRFGAVVYRGAVTLDETRQRLQQAMETDDNLGGAALIFPIFNAYARLYQQVSLTVRRRQELEADAAAARIAGREVTADALREVHALQAAWQDFLAELARYHRLGLTPDDPYRAFGSLLADPGYQLVLATRRANPPQQPPSQHDSHPSLARRLTALERLPDPPRDPEDDEDPGSAADLVTGFSPTDGDDGRRQRQRRRRLPDPPLPPTATSLAVLPCEQWLEAVAEARAVAPARKLVRAASRLTGRPDATLDMVLSLLQAGRRHDLAAALHVAKPTAPASPANPAGPGDPAETAEEDGLARLAAALFALVGQSLVTIGRASWRIRWTAASQLISDRAPVAELQTLVAAAVQRPRDVARLRLHLAAHGVDVQVPVVLSREAPQADVVAVTAVADSGAEEEHHTRRTVAAASLVVLGILFLVYLAAPEHQRTPSGLPGYPQTYPRSTDYSQSYPGSTRYPLSTDPLHTPPVDISPWLTTQLDQTHTIVIKRGDTLSQLAWCYDTTEAKLQQLNHMDPNNTKLIAGRHFTVNGPKLPFPGCF